MDWLTQITLGELVLAAIGAGLARDLAVRVLPDRIAGPGGWLLDTSGPEG